jgi:hypothetical protein
VFIRDDIEVPWISPLPSLKGHNCREEYEHWIKFDLIHWWVMCSYFDDPKLVMRQALDN